MDQFDSASVLAQVTTEEAVSATLLAHTPDVIWRLDRELRFLYVNTAMTRWMGRMPATFTGKTGTQAGIPDAVWQPIAAKCHEAFTAARMTQLEFSDETPQGLRYFSARLIPEFGRDGGIATLLGIIADITEQWRAQSALRESEEKLALATDAAGLGVFDHDLVNDKMYWDHRAATLWGIASGSPMTHEVIQAHVHPDYRASNAEAIKRALDFTGNGRFYREYRVATRAGEAERWLGSTGRVLFEGGRAVRRIGMIQDITERKLAQERALLEKDELLLLAERACNVGSFEWLVPTDVLHLSPRMVAMFGLQSFEGRHDAWLRLIHPDDRIRYRNIFKGAFARRDATYTMELRLMRPGGEVCWIETHGNVRYDDVGKPLRVVGQHADITEHKEAERRLIDANENLRRMSLSQTRLIEEERSRIARNLHDGVGQLLYLAGLKLSAATRMALGKSLRGTLEDVFGVIGRATRDIRSIEFELSPPHLRQFGLLPALVWLAEDMERQFGLVVEITDDPHDKPLDPFMSAILYRAVRELLINVAKHAQVESAGIVVRRTHAGIEITVQDRGVGMRGQDIMSSGRGLGLREMREALVSGGGTFALVSPVDGGTMATLTAPLRATTDAGAQRLQPESPAYEVRSKMAG